ncbi:MAG: alanine--glyoxylate aminotransferase family protein [Chitinophagales bacterium]|nr:alanine--glyoxylate aminotransferase family protein [Chitinophagales bacterium]MCZ2394412.1 alanine--glyoxylate aminotransferase family protein [Chitinophagales bacterium]
MSQIQAVKTSEVLLLGPGPSNSFSGVLQAMSEPALSHLDSDFLKIMDEVKEHLQYLFRTSSPHTYIVSGPGSLGMETCFVNLIEHGDKIITCQNGFFGDRMHENARRYGAEIVQVKADWGKPIAIEDVERAFVLHPDAKLISVVSAETSTGVKNDIESIAKIAKQYGALIIVDAVTALGAIPVEVDKWGLDAVYSCSQKGIGCVAGMSPVTFSELAFEKVNNRNTPVPSWFQDITVYDKYWELGAKRPYHHTAPSQQYYGILAALRHIKSVGIENLWRQHEEISSYFAENMEKRGWRFFVDKSHRLPQLNTMLLPEGIEDAQGRARLRNDFKIEVGAGLGAMAGKLWRIGIMGANVNKAAIDKFLLAIDNL